VDFCKIAQERRDTRKFEKKDVSEGALKDLLECANNAPSAGNLQAIGVLVVKDKRRKEEIAKAAYGQVFVKEAPVVLLIFANKKESSQRYGKRGELYSVQDATIYATYLTLRAHEQGLATCWVGAFDPDKVRGITGADMSIEPVIILPLGYPAEKPGNTSRKKIDDYVHKEVFE
jgi:nitroreductase